MPWRSQPPGETHPAELLASDADRDRVVTILGEAFGDGRLDMSEHADRVERAHTARTLGDLAPLTTDLIPAEDQPIQVDARPVTAFFGAAERKGRWVVPATVTAYAVCGKVQLDLHEALLQRRHVVVQATVFAGELKLLVPEGVNVRLATSTVLANKSVRVRVPEGRADGPLIEIRGTIVGGQVTARTPKRSLRQRIRGR